MKRLLYITLLVLFVSFNTQAQQIGIYSNYMMNTFYYNPAVAGSQGVYVLNAGYRNQWVGFKNAPSIFNFNVHGSYKSEGKIGYGLGLYNESTGLMNTTGFHLTYAHHFKLTENLKLALGVQPGFLQYKFRLYDAIIADEGDQVLLGSVYSTNALDVNMGFNLYSEKFFVMASAQRLLGKAIKFTGYNSQLQFHYNFIAGYNFNFEKKKFDFQPSILIRYTKPAPVQISGMLKFMYNKQFWLATIYRHDEAIGINAGYTFKERYTISYGYDFCINKLRKYTTGSHEVMISIILNKKKPTLQEEDEKLNNSILEETKMNSNK
ncbi:MAG: type IX secretion system membrane protein PorP/SprF [Crocinitomicaceae bacterium]|nr:type IX secretion system membrane protein PorP/SprF [Crocinitomicaceae bacterium]